MTQTHFTSTLFDLKDLNITLEDRIEIRTYRQRKEKVIFGTLTYRPSTCPECGVKNNGTQGALRHGYATVHVLIGQYNFQAVCLNSKKQRCLCKHCQHTFVATTDLVKRHCFISETIKEKVTFKLKETQSLSLSGKHFNISVHTVIRCLDELSESLRQERPALVTHLSLDEFQLSKKDSSMACVLTDNE